MFLDIRKIESHLELLEREIREIDRILDIIECRHRQSLEDIYQDREFLRKQLEFAKKEKNRILLRRNTLTKTMNISIRAKEFMEDKVDEAIILQKDSKLF